MRNLSAFQPNTAGGTTKAYYPLNGNSTDYSGNTNTGTDTSITYPQGRFGQGAKFNGTSSQILFTTVPQTGAGSFTASLWLKANSLLTNMEILFWGNLATHQGFDVYLNGSGVMSGNFYGGGGQANATTKLTTHSWQLVTLTYDGNNTRIYIDGRLEGTSTAYTSSNLGTTNKFIGKDAAGGNWWNGFADEIILESRAWTAKEVETYYRKSTLNYGRKTWGQLLLSILALDTITTSETFTSIRSRISSTVETVTTSETVTALKAFLVSVVDTVTTSEVFTSLRSRISSIIDTIMTSEPVTLVRQKWEEKTRASTTWTEKSDNTTTWTEKTDNSTTWTEKPKN